jgi:hypothetical protein
MVGYVKIGGCTTILAQFSSTSGIQNSLTYMYYTSKDRKLPITELKWDARTLTHIPGNTAYWFFVFFWQTKGSRNIPENLWSKSEVKNHGRVGKNCRLYNHFGSIFVHFRSP